MKVHLIRIAVIVLAVVSPLLAMPVAARPKDPDSFLVKPIQQDDCTFGASFGDPFPLTGLCPSGLPELATTQPVSGHPAEAQSLLRTAENAVTRAGSLQYTLEMQMMTNIGGGSGTAQSTFVGDYVAPEESPGALTIANP